MTIGQNTEPVAGTKSTKSLFETLFGQQKDGVVTYDVPFPFTSLTQRIAANLAVHERKAPSLLQVLIPLGRSLQRYAAEPEYFRYPGKARRDHRWESLYKGDEMTGLFS